MKSFERTIYDKKIFNVYKQVHKNKEVSKIDNMTDNKIGYHMYKHK